MCIRDSIVAASEFEALVLECSLIKRYMPKYNILLKDDKGYPYLRLNMKDIYPVITMVSKPADDGADYYGPYGGRAVTHDVMEAIRSNSSTASLKNDDGMRTVANARLDDLEHKIEVKGDVLGYQFFNKVDAKWDDDKKNATLTLVAKYDYNDTTLQKIIDQIKGSDQNEALDFALKGNYTKAGVVARIIHGQTYVAISLRVGRNL